VEDEVTFTWEEFLALPRTEVSCDIHCVTHWSRLDNRFEGVSIREIIRRVRVKPEARYVLIHADPDYTTNLPLEDLVDDDVLLTLTHDGQDLTPDHGGPLRLVVPSSTFGRAQMAPRLRSSTSIRPASGRSTATTSPILDQGATPTGDQRDARCGPRPRETPREIIPLRGGPRLRPESPHVLEVLWPVGGHGVTRAGDFHQAPVGQALGHLLGHLGREDVALRAAHDQGRAGDARQWLPQVHHVAPPRAHHVAQPLGVLPGEPAVGEALEAMAYALAKQSRSWSGLAQWMYSTAHSSLSIRSGD
jgi:hypothetical protein